MTLKIFKDMFILSNEQISALPEWMAIEGFEGLYEVNPREGLVRNSRTLRVLKASPESNGYPHVGLYKDGKRQNKKIHRIVALTSFEYYNISIDGLDVCHLDEERFNPKVSNLAVGTTKENMNFPKLKQRMSETMKGERLSAEVKKKLSDAIPKKAVGAYKNGELILRFRSTREAGRNGFDNSTVSACCRGKKKHHKGYEWKYLTA